MAVIIVQRSGALGDVILTTPIVRRLRRENPDTPIAVLTGCHDVFRGNPHLNVPVPGDYSNDVRQIQLDLAYEFQPHTHVVRAYMTEAFGDLGDPKDLQQELFAPFQLTPIMQYRHYVAVHATTAGWVNRTLPRSTWSAVVDGIRKAGLWPVLVGTERDDIPGCEVTRFFSYDLLAQTNFISRCVAFVGSDSGLLHAAGATDVPIVGVFTCALPETRLPYRRGKLGYNCTAIVPEGLDCIGCLTRRPPPVTSEFCERGDTICVERVGPEQIIEAVIAATQNFS